MKVAKQSLVFRISPIELGGRQLLGRTTNPEVPESNTPKIQPFGGNDFVKEAKRFAKDVDTDLTNIHDALTGRVSFGRLTDGDRGENMSGECQQFTSHATPDTEFSVTHTVGAIPKGYIIMWQDKAGSMYQGPTTGTNWTTTAVSLKCSVASVTFNVFLIK
jgi:hypothetical protein